MKSLALLLALTLAALLVVACGTAAPTTSAPPTTVVPTPNVVVDELPTPGPTAAPTAPLVTLPTPAPHQQWEVQEVSVDGSTVTVGLHVFAGVDVDVVLDGEAPETISGAGPILEHIFTDVAPGTHTVMVMDIVGYSESRQITVLLSEEEGSLPRWLAQIIRDQESTTPPQDERQSISRYERQGEVVYLQTLVQGVACCDHPGNVYDAEGTLLGYPGEFGTVPWEEWSYQALVWRDRRQPVIKGNVPVLAPIDQFELNIAESFPLQYFVQVVSGLPSGCASPGGYTILQDGTHIIIKVYNQQPADREIACTMIYGYEETNISLGSGFDPNTTYTVDVNGKRLAFKGDQVMEVSSEPVPTLEPQDTSLAVMQAQLDENRRLWESQGLDAYEMEFRWVCFCHPDYTVLVKVNVSSGDNIDSVAYAENGLPVDQTMFGGFKSVDGLFELIQEAIAKEAHRISVEYHPILGYPVSAGIDYDERIADEERGFSLVSVSATN
ncbi:MAG: DUF6174 domain-containing protein [Dehalococcoidia bacterium]